METENNNNYVPDVETFTCEWCNEKFCDTDVDYDVASEQGLLVTERHELHWRGAPTVICECCYEDNLRTCEDCDDVLHCNRDEYTYVGNYNDRLVCDYCLRDNYNWCESCEEYSHNDYPCDCSDSSNLISSYSRDMKNDIHFYISKGLMTSREPSGTVVTGFENEMECVEGDLHECAELAHNLFSPHGCILKEDGSISHGFELVTSPMTLQYAQDVFPFESMRELANAGMRSSMTETCGLHVHINKGYFDRRPTSMYRFMAMFHRNNEVWQKLGGRKNSSYARWNEDEQERMIEYVKYAASQGIHGLRNNYERYVAINLQNRNTIELRFFKGTLRPLALQARIEAVHAVAEYSVATRNTGSIKSAYDWERFRNWTVSNKKYNAFNKYAETKGV
jgi:hypothetical protein